MNNHKNNIVEINYTNESTIAKAMRRVRDYYPSAYAKLLGMKWVWTIDTPFAQTDGRELRLNRRGVDAINQSSDPVGHMAFLLVHEALHGLLNHGARLAELEDRDTANIAADYIINAMIKEVNDTLKPKLRYEPFPMINGCLFDIELSASRSVKELYTELMFRNLSPEDPEEESSGIDAGDDDGDDDDGDDGDSKDESNDDGDSKDDEDAEDGDDSKDSDDPSPDDGDGSTDGDPDDECDSENGGGGGDDDADEDDSKDKGQTSGDLFSGDADDDAEGGSSANQAQTQDSNANPSDDELLKGFAGTGADDTFKPEASEEDKDNGLTDEDMSNEVEKANEQIILTEQMDAAAGISGNTGLRAIEAHRTQREGLRWDEYLSEWLTARSQSGWDKPFNNVIFSASKLVCAGRGSKALNELVIAVDVSGSITDAVLARIMGSIEEAMDAERPQKVWLVAFSHEVTDVIEIEAGDPIPTTMKGGGGTLFQPVWDWVEQNAPSCDGVVMLTDMKAYDLIAKKNTVPPAAPILFVSYGLKNADFTSERRFGELPYGELVEVTLN